MGNQTDNGIYRKIIFNKKQYISYLDIAYLTTVRSLNSYNNSNTNSNSNSNSKCKFSQLNLNK